MPPWNGQADIRFGLVNLMVIGHSSLKHNSWWKWAQLILILFKNSCLKIILVS